MKDSQRNGLLVALLALGAVFAATAAVRIFLPERDKAAAVMAFIERATGGKKSSDSGSPVAVAKTPVAGAETLSETRPLVRTDTLEIGDVPNPGSHAAPAPHRSSSAAPPASSGGGIPTGSIPEGVSRTAARIDASAPSPEKSGETPGSEPVAAARRPGSPAAARSSDKSKAKGSDAGASALTGDAAVAAQAKGLLSQARDFKVKGGVDAELDLGNPAAVRQAVMRQMTLENAVDKSLRASLGRLGPGADVEDQRKAAAEALSAHGAPVDEISITNALAAASGPPQPAPSPAALDAAVKNFSAASRAAPDGGGAGGEEVNTIGPGPGAGGIPAPETTGADLVAPAPAVAKAFVPNERPPRGAAAAYQKYKGAFDEAYRRFHVAPWDILGVLQQESGFGANMGKTPLPQGLARRPADLAAAIKLQAAGRLPAPYENLRGSSTGALGPGQFEPATHMYAGRGDPFNWNDLIGYSMPHLLILNGYKPDDPAAQRKAYGRYYGDGNPDGKYATSVAGHAAAIRTVVEREKAAAAAPVP